MASWSQGMGGKGEDGREIRSKGHSVHLFGDDIIRSHTTNTSQNPVKLPSFQ